MRIRRTPRGSANETSDECIERFREQAPLVVTPIGEMLAHPFARKNALLSGNALQRGRPLLFPLVFFHQISAEVFDRSRFALFRPAIRQQSGL